MNVRGLPQDFPDYLDVDITNVDIGQTIKVGELSYENLQILDPLRSMVAAVVSSRLIAKGMAAEIEEEVEVEEEEGVEGEEGVEEGAPKDEATKDEAPATKGDQKDKPEQKYY
jgi:large subunit ribosomal protein L25